MELKDYFSMLQSGDKNAFINIYNELKTPVFTIACRIVQSREVAEDITHDVFVKLYTSPPDSTVNNPRAWVFQMARNLSIDALRRKTCDDIDGVELAAADELDGTLTRIDIEKAIGRLELDERDILSLHLVCDLGFVEISRIVGMSLPAVYRRYRKAIKSVRDYMNGGEQ